VITEKSAVFFENMLLSAKAVALHYAPKLRDTYMYIRTYGANGEWHGWSQELNRLKACSHTDVYGAVHLMIESDICEFEARAEFDEKCKAMRTRLSQIPVGSSFADATIVDLSSQLLGSQLNTLFDIVAFGNGIFNFKTMRFREGTITDHVSIGIPHAFRSISETGSERCAARLATYIECLFPDHRERFRMLCLIAKMLRGCSSSGDQQRYILLQGDWLSGKSTFLRLLQSAFGDYMCTVPVRSVRNLSASNAAAFPHVPASARVAVVELDDNVDSVENIMCRFPKSGRQLFASAYPLHCCVLMVTSRDCSAVDPTVPRIQLPFTFRKNPSSPVDRLADTTLGECIADLAPEFISMAIQELQMANSGGIVHNSIAHQNEVVEVVSGMKQRAIAQEMLGAQIQLVHHLCGPGRCDTVRLIGATIAEQTRLFESLRLPRLPTESDGYNYLMNMPLRNLMPDGMRELMEQYRNMYGAEPPQPHDIRGWACAVAKKR
jgi:hypothetical protein